MNISYYDSLAGQANQIQSNKFRESVEDQRQKEEEEKERKDNIVSSVAPFSEEMIRHGGLGLVQKGLEEAGLKGTAGIVKILRKPPKEIAQQLYKKATQKVGQALQDGADQGISNLRNRISQGGVKSGDAANTSASTEGQANFDSGGNGGITSQGGSQPVTSDVDQTPLQSKRFQPSQASDQPITQPKATPQSSSGASDLSTNPNSSLDTSTQFTKQVQTPAPDTTVQPSKPNADTEFGDDTLQQPRRLTVDVASGKPQGATPSVDQQATKTLQGQVDNIKPSTAQGSASAQAKISGEPTPDEPAPTGEGASTASKVSDGLDTTMETLAETGEAENPVGLLVEAGLGIASLFASIFGSKVHHNAPVKPSIINPSVGFGLNPN
jgi:hypothetical protein